MKRYSRWTLLVGLALAIAVVVATVRNPERPTEPAALAHAKTRDSSKAISRGEPRPTELAALDDGQDSASRASPEAQEENLQSPVSEEVEINIQDGAEEGREPNEDDEAEDDETEDDDVEYNADEDHRKILESAPEEAKRAIEELASAGVRVVLSRRTDDENPAGDSIGVSFQTADPGFQASFTRKALGQLLRSLPKVDAIDLSDTDLTDDHLEHLRECPKLTRLVLHNTPITDKGLAHLTALHDLHSLFLSSTSITDEGLASLAGLHDLNCLSLAKTQIGDSGLAHLGDMKELNTLFLSRTRVTDAGLQSLEPLEGLQYLWLENANISGAGLTHLCGLPLQCLWLNGTPVTDAALVHLKDMTYLYQLYLYDTKVTKAGRDQLLRDAPNLQGIKGDDGATHGGVIWGSSFANNPATVDNVTPDQVARLKDVLWWLPADSELVCVAHGPFAFVLPGKERDCDDTLSRFQNWVLPNVPDVDESALDEVPVALIVYASRVAFGGCDIVVFERPLGDAGDAFMAAVGKIATKMEPIVDTEAAVIDRSTGETHWTTLVARPAPDVLLFADNRECLANVLERMAKKAGQRALPEDLPEWKHLDLGARQWAIRHYQHAPNGESRLVGLVYSVQGGDAATIRYLTSHGNDVRLAKRSYPVRTEQNLTDFFWMLFCELRKLEPQSQAQEGRRGAAETPPP